MINAAASGDVTSAMRGHRSPGQSSTRTSRSSPSFQSNCWRSSCAHCSCDTPSAYFGGCAVGAAGFVQTLSMSREHSVTPTIDSESVGRKSFIQSNSVSPAFCRKVICRSPHIAGLRDSSSSRKAGATSRVLHSAEFAVSVRQIAELRGRNDLDCG